MIVFQKKLIDRKRPNTIRALIYHLQVLADHQNLKAKTIVAEKIPNPVQNSINSDQVDHNSDSQLDSKRMKNKVKDWSKTDLEWDHCLIPDKAGINWKKFQMINKRTHLTVTCQTLAWITALITVPIGRCWQIWLRIAIPWILATWCWLSRKWQQNIFHLKMIEKTFISRQILDTQPCKLKESLEEYP